MDMSLAARGHSGTGVYVEQLVTALRHRPELELIDVHMGRRLQPGRTGRVRNPLRSAANAALDLAWERSGLARAARDARADVLHHPLPGRSPRARCAQVVTVHDVTFERFPEQFDPAWRAITRRQHRAAVRAADAIVCPSRATAEDAVELLGATRERVIVAPHGPGQAIPVPGERTASHLLYVGSDEPRKGVGALLAAYEEASPGLDLVLAGEAARRAGPPGVRGVPDPDPKRLGELLAGAVALVHPAALEGFGLTLLEAMAAGVPVVTVRSPSAVEVCDDDALLVEQDELGDALKRVATDPALRDRLASAGRRRAGGFSWAASAEAHETAYRAAVERHGERK